jgi:hypothetical protein
MIVKGSDCCGNEFPGMLRRLAGTRSAGRACCRPLTVTMMDRRSA